MGKNLRFYLVLLAMLLVGTGVFLATYGFPEGQAAPSLSIQFSNGQIQLEYAGHRASLGDKLDGVETEALDGGAYRICFGDVSVLFAGPDGILPEVPATVLVLGETGQGLTIPESAAPSFAIVNTGTAPSEEALRLLDKTCKQVLRRDLQGNIVLYTDGNEVWFSVEKEASSVEIFPYRKNTALEAIQIDYTYVLNQNSKAFHLPSCPSVEQMKEENKLFSSESLEALLAMGYHPCGSCQP